MHVHVLLPPLCIGYEQQKVRGNKMFKKWWNQIQNNCAVHVTVLLSQLYTYIYCYQPITHHEAYIAVLNK
jgi:hypothetical protein